MLEFEGCGRVFCGRHCNGVHDLDRAPFGAACTCGQPYWSVIPQVCPVHATGTSYNSPVVRWTTCTTGTLPELYG